MCAGDIGHAIGEVANPRLGPGAARGLGLRIGEQVLLKACQQQKEWQQAGLPQVKVTVNLSVHQLNESFIESVRRILQTTAVDPANVDRALAAIDLEVGRVAAEGITVEERDNAVRYLIGSIPRMLETNAGTAQFLIGAEQFDLGDDFDRRLPGLLAAVTRDEASAAAAALDTARAVVAVAGPGA